MDERTSEPRVNVVANAPPSARVRLYVDGLPYPKEQSNVLVEGTNGLGIWDMYIWGGIRRSWCWRRPMGSL